MTRRTWATCLVIAWVCTAAAGGESDVNASGKTEDTGSENAQARAPKTEAVSWITGTWNGTRRGHPVTWRFLSEGRAYVEDRGATWSVLQDTLRVDFDPVGESSMGERAVYRCLVSNPLRGPRRMFLLGFDLGADGLLLTREFDPNDAEHAPDTVDRSTPPSMSSKK